MPSPHIWFKNIRYLSSTQHGIAALWIAESTHSAKHELAIGQLRKVNKDNKKHCSHEWLEAYEVDLPCDDQVKPAHVARYQPVQMGNNSAAYEPTPECPKPNGIFPNTRNCSSFFLCNDGEHHKQACPGGLHYDKKRVKCNFPKKAKCRYGDKVKKLLRKPSSTEKPKPKKSKHCPKMDGIFPNSANCSTFYFCVDGAAYLQECPWGLVFDENNVKCDFPKVVGCKPPPGMITVLRCPTDDGLFRHPTECGTFFLCKKGRSYEYHCPEGLIFDYNVKRCEYPRNVKCPEHHLDRRKHIHNYMKVVQINIFDYVT